MAHHGARQTHQLLTPSIELPRADPVFARNLGRRQVRPQAFENDLALPLHGPGPTPFGRAKDLSRRKTSARKTNLTSVLSRENQVRRRRIHSKIESQNAYASPDAVATTLTARADVFDYVERFYNPTRRHSTIDYVSPMEFERIAAAA